MQHSTKRRIMLGMTTGGVLMTGLGMSTAHADATAAGAATNSPGIGSGNLIQLPVNAPINVCGNQLDVIGILDTVIGSTCQNGGTSASGESNSGTAASGTAQDSPGIASGNLVQIPVNAPVNVCGNQVGTAGAENTDHGSSCTNSGSGSTTASSSSSDSPGIASGNVIQVPINAPVNVCGNQVDVIGILDAVGGSTCVSQGGPGNPTTTPTPTDCGCPPPIVTTRSSAPGTPDASSNAKERSAKPTGALADTGSGALAVAPLAAGLIGSGALLLKSLPTQTP